MKRWLLSISVTMVLIMSTLSLADKPVSKYRIQKLITDLNNREETNKTAQLELVEIGRQAVPALLEQVKLYADPTEANCSKAARALHILAQMKNTDAIPLVKGILINFVIPTPQKPTNPVDQSWYTKTEDAMKRAIMHLPSPTKTQCALRSEALEYIYNVFAEKEARDVYFSLVTKHSSQYYGASPFMIATYGKYDNSSNPYKSCLSVNTSSAPPRLMLNVFKGIPLMIQARDSRAEDVAIHLLQTLPYQPRHESCFIAFSTGWEPVNVSAISPEYGKQMLDSQNRFRMVAMRYLHELKSRKAIPDLENMLESPNPDERNYALVTLEEITSGGIDPEIPPSQLSEEDKYDKIVLRNGDSVTGMVMNASLHLKTSYGNPEFKTAVISYIKMEGADSRTDSLELRNGDKLSGSLTDENFTIKLKAGQMMAIKKKDITSITFRRVWTEEEE